MPKELKSAEEIAALISERIGIGGTIINVTPDPLLGWQATVVTARPRDTLRCQMMAEDIATRLRTSYDLKS